MYMIVQPNIRGELIATHTYIDGFVNITPPWKEREIVTLANCTVRAR